LVLHLPFLGIAGSVALLAPTLLRDDGNDKLSDGSGWDRKRGGRLDDVIDRSHHAVAVSGAGRDGPIRGPRGIAQTCGCV
jgi:hypothetical protein